MNKLPFTGTSSMYYTSQGLVREKPKKEKRSRSKTVSDGRSIISKTTSRSSEDERTSSPSPELVHTIPPIMNAVEDLPALPDSVPPTPATTAVQSDAADTPKATPSAGTASQYLQPFVEDAPEQPLEPKDKEEPPPVADSIELPPASGAVENPTKPGEGDSDSTAKPEQFEVKVEEETVATASEISKPANEPSETSGPTAPPSQAESVTSQAPPSSAASSAPTVPAGAVIPHQHFHPAHGLPQHYAYHHPQNPYIGYPQSRETNMSPVPYQQSPGFPPLLSYSPIPAFPPYPPLHSMSMIPAGHVPHPYQQPPPALDLHQSQGPPARMERAPAHYHDRKDDEIVIRQIADLLPDIIRLVTNDRHEKADMKAIKTQYEKVIETLTADRNTLRHDIAELRQKADQVDGLTADNVRLITEKQAAIKDVVSLKEERVVLLESRDMLRKINAQHESTIAEMKQQLEAERRSNYDALDAAKIDANRKVRLADEATSKLRSELAALAERNRQITGADDTTTKLRSELTELRNDRNNRIKDYDTLKKDYATTTSHFEAKVRELEEALERSRKSRADSTSRPLERSTSVSGANGRDTGSRNIVSSQHEGSAPAPTRRPNLSQTPASHRHSIASQYFQSSSTNRSTTADRLPGGYDYYDNEPPKGEQSGTMTLRSNGTNENGRSDNRGPYHAGSQG